MIPTPATPQVPLSTVGSSHVQVFVRTRPLLEEERAKGSRNILTIDSAEKQVGVEDGGGIKFYKFDSVFDEGCSQEDVYRRTVASLVKKVERGHNATVFAYGQTGSGKTFTMGTDPGLAKEDEGILQRAMHTLLGNDSLKIDDEDKALDETGTASNTPPILTISFLEVYSETIYDLLAPSRTALKTKAEVGGGVSAIGMVKTKVESVEDGLMLLEKGSHLRRVGATAMNQHSSRSHALIYLTVENGCHQGCLKLVDLAGAESVGRSETSTQMFNEGVAINKGLLTLGKVLAALSNPHAGHIPYRETILTRLLKDSLGGNGHTTMIACVNPASFNVHETINTLRYAEQTRNIRTKPQVPSTLKRPGIKRRCEDITATPGAWKRRAMASAKKPEHNSTISTPGHKPQGKPVRPKLNTSLVTPRNKVSEVHPRSEMKTDLLMPPPLPTMMLIPPQPIFEDDSPSRFSTISAIDIPENNPTTFSPVMDRMTTRLEQSVMNKLETFENRLADRIISRLTMKKRKGKMSRSNTRKRESFTSRSSTPTSEENLSHSSNDSSDDNLLGKSVANALLKKKKVQRMLQDMITTAVQNVTSVASPKNRKSHNRMGMENSSTKLNKQQRRPLTNVTNIQDPPSQPNFAGHEKTLPYVSNTSVFESKHVMNLPITSTAFIDNRAVRRSTRLSSRHSVQHAIFKEMSPLAGKPLDSPPLFTPDQENETVMYRSQTELPRTYESTTLLLGFEGSPHESTTLLLGFEGSPHLRAPKVKSPLCEVQGEGATMNIDPSHAIKCSSGSEKDMTIVSPLQIDRMQPKKGNAVVRRSSRMSALKATQRNFEILSGQSPCSKICSTKTPKRKKELNANVTVCVNPTELDSSLNQSTGKWNLVISPRLQKQHNEKILSILNSGNLRTLQQLPTVGPKTAWVIKNFREMCGELKSIEDLKDVPGLPKTYYLRFMKANLMNQLCF